MTKLNRFLKRARFNRNSFVEYSACGNKTNRDLITFRKRVKELQQSLTHFRCLYSFFIVNVYKFSFLI